MKVENHKPVKPDNESRRSFAKAGVAVPIIMTLTSKAALGSVYDCTISGIQSGNASNEAKTPPNCGVGYSPGAWWQNANKTVGDGNINKWCAAGVNPFTIKKVGTGPTAKKYVVYKGVDIEAINTTGSGGAPWRDIYNAIKTRFNNWNAPATTFNSIFGGANSKSVWTVLDEAKGQGSENDNLEWHAIADYLNAALYASSPGTNAALSPVYSGLSKEDIAALYNLAKVGTAFYSSEGVLITSSFNNGDILGYLKMIHH